MLGVKSIADWLGTGPNTGSRHISKVWLLVSKDLICIMHHARHVYANHLSLLFVFGHGTYAPEI